MKPFSNFEEFKRNADKFVQDVQRIVKNGVAEAAGYAEAEAKRGASAVKGYANGKTYHAHVLGHHAGMINAKSINNGYTARLNANADYAPYLEFGTGTLVDVPEGFEKKAIAFKGKGIRKINLPARPHIIPAAMKARDFLHKQIEKQISEL